MVKNNQYTGLQQYTVSPFFSRNAIVEFPYCSMACFLGVRTTKSTGQCTGHVNQQITTACQYMLSQCPALLFLNYTHHFEEYTPHQRETPHLLLPIYKSTHPLTHLRSQHLGVRAFPIVKYLREVHSQQIMLQDKVAR